MFSPGIYRSNSVLIRAALCVLLGNLVAGAVFADEDSNEVKLGRRLFEETRFSQYFFAHSNGDVNAHLETGDPVMSKSVMVVGKGMDGPFAGQAMNCRACHLVTEFRNSAGIRSYTDFGRRSPIPDRGDGLTVTVRRSPPLVTAQRKGHTGVVLHRDGEFPSMTELVKGTFSGRNFGWLPGERDVAVHQVAEVIRNDDGTGQLAKDMFYGYSYSMLISSGAPVTRKAKLPPQYQGDISKLSDEEIFNKVAEFVTLYVRSLQFHTDSETGEFDGSPYDMFLRKNNLPCAPRPLHPGLLETESDIAYTRALRQAIDGLKDPAWVVNTDQKFYTHKQEFKFGPEEFAGLKIFLAESPGGGGPESSNHVGNCIACHMAPSFTDFGFHNTGAAQEEFDGIHGAGAFARLPIPSLKDRDKDYDSYLQKTANHPHACAMYESVPDSKHPCYTDLGVWNIFANPDLPYPQGRIANVLLLSGGDNSRDAMLERAIARFKTPSVRDLGHCAPYLHTGAKDKLQDVIVFYMKMSVMARKGAVRNADPSLSRIHLDPSDFSPLVAFLRALNEDYED